MAIALGCLFGDMSCGGSVCVSYPAAMLSLLFMRASLNQTSEFELFKGVEPDHEGSHRPNAVINIGGVVPLTKNFMGEGLC